MSYFVTERSWSPPFLLPLFESGCAQSGLFKSSAKTSGGHDRKFFPVIHSLQFEARKTSFTSISCGLTDHR
jgi:hypothetical protein